MEPKDILDGMERIDRIEAELEHALTVAEDARDEAARVAEANAALEETLARRDGEIAALRAELARREAGIEELRRQILAGLKPPGAERQSMEHEELLVALEELHVTNEELQQANEALERRVMERTARLLRSEERLGVAQRYAGADTWEWDLAADSVACMGRPPQPRRDWLGTVHAEDRERADRALRDCLDRRAEGLEVEHRLAPPAGAAGEERWRLIRAHLVLDGQGRPERALGLSLDITERKRAEQELRAAKEEAEAARREADRANADKSRFLAAASHDLRQPAMAIGLFLDLLKRRGLDPEAAEMVAMASSAVEGLSGMLNGLLQVSRLEAGIVRPEPRGFDLGELLRRLAAEFERQAREAGLRFRVATGPRPVTSDPLLVELVLRNLISNAVKYTREGEVAVEVVEGPDGIRIEVADTGPGIPAEEAERIFEEFHQIGGADRQGMSGFGLGLATAARVAALLGSRIDLRSAPGEGSTFGFALPRGEEEGAPAAAGAEAEERGLDGRSILVIEDEPAVLKGLLMMFRSWGMEAHGARSLAEVEAVLARLGRPLDLLVADYSLGLDERGTEAVSLVRRRWPVPAVIVTGDVAPQRLAEIRAGGHPLLHKPLRPEELRARLGRMLAAGGGEAMR